MRITKAEFIPIRAKGTSTLRISKGSTQVAYSVLVKVETDEGTIGFGEAVSGPPGYPEELQEEIIAALKHYLQPDLFREDPSNILAIREKMDRIINGKYWTKAAVITALYDLMGKARKVPVYKLLGGTWRERIPNLAGMVGIDTPDNMVRKALSFTEKGATTIKLKIGDTVNADADRILAVREAIGPEIGIRVDANSHYQAEEAIRLIKKVEKYNILHVEAPVDKHDIISMAKVNQSVDVPIMSDESVRNPIEAKTLCEMNAVDIIKVKVTKMGFDLAGSILKIAKDSGKKCILGHMLELGVAGTAEAHFALAHPELIEPHEIGSIRTIGISEDIIKESVDACPNNFSLYKGDGLGVTLNEEKIKSSRVDI
jgi:L-alanine-DL-glutamate epimerase-like enolase superfamily enzyme